MEVPEHLLKKYHPMTESTFYVLLSLFEPRHGYAMIQFIQQLTRGRIHMGTGTLYTMLGRLVEDQLITILSTDDGKKTYQITATGNSLMRLELDRLADQLKNGEEVYEKYR